MPNPLYENSKKPRISLFVVGSGEEIESDLMIELVNSKTIETANTYF